MEHCLRKEDTAEHCLINTASSTKNDLKYVDGYIDENTFQWETVANVSDRELNAIKSSKKYTSLSGKWTMRMESSFHLPILALDIWNM